MKTLPANVYKQLVILSNRAEFQLAIAIRIDTNCESLPEMFKNKSSDYYRGLADGAYTAMEDILSARKAYQGYSDGKIPGTKFYYFQSKVGGFNNRGKDAEYVVQRAIEKMAS